MIGGSATVSRAGRSAALKLALASALAVAAATPGVAAAPTALVNGHIYAAGKQVEAIGLADGKVAAIGDRATVLAALPKDAAVIDLAGATVFPGFHDSHVHPLAAGMLLTKCTFPQDADRARIQTAVAACVKAAKPGAWITGGQWTAATLAAGELDRVTLDAVAPNNPVSLVDTSGHSYWLNSAGLAAAGITAATATPAGGVIEKDASGKPTGLLRDAAAAIARRAIPPAEPAETLAALRNALSTLTANGITSLTDAIVQQDNLAAYMALAEEGALKQRVRGCLLWGETNPEFEALLTDRAKYARPTFKLDCVKVFMDGVPTESHTSAMLAPYEKTTGTPAGAPERGLLMIAPDVIDPLTTRLDKMGVMVKFHAAGDWAVRASIDAVAAARKANGTAGPSHQVGHLTFVDQADMARAKPLGLTLEYSPYLWFPQPIVEDIEKAVGEERNLRAWPVAEGLATGALAVVGSDWPIVPSPSPWIAIETLVTRKSPGNAGTAYGAKEAVTLDQAIALFNSAGGDAFGDGSGRLTPGTPADLVVVDKDPHGLPIGEVHTIKTLRTVIGGETVYEAR